MKTISKPVVSAVLATMLLAGCTTADYGAKQGVGTVGGAVLGGIAGSRFGGGTGKLVAVGAGTLLGAFLGNEVGKSLDRADHLYAQQASTQAYAAPIGQTIQWNNPNSGNYGTITPVRDGLSSTGSYCREYQQTITVGGRTEQAFGVACQQADGTWKLVS